MDRSPFFSDLDDLDRRGLRRHLRVADKENWVNFSSNDYLGLSHHPDIQKAASDALSRFGVGGTSSRLLAGTKSPHVALEGDLARFLGKEAALLFSSGYHANTGIIPAMAQAGDVLFVDRLCHASILDGVRLSHARFFTFQHNDMDDLEALLRSQRSKYERAFIITEGIFSMDGDFSLLKRLVDLSGHWEAMMYLDEAHSFGIWGPDGRGVAAKEGVLDKIPIFVATLSKALGSQGGFVACGDDFKNLMVSRARSFIYTTALAPAWAEAAKTALNMLPSLDSHRKQLEASARHLREELGKLGYSLMRSESQIIPVWTGDVSATKDLSDYLLSHGFFVPSIRPPTVPAGEGRVRLSVTVDVIQKGVDPLLNLFRMYSKRPQKGGAHLVQAG